MPKFRNTYDYKVKENNFSQDLSRVLEPVYELDENNIPIKVGDTNVYEIIQECAEETDIYNVIERFNRGDLLAFRQRDAATAMDGDLSSLPTDLLGSMDNMDRALASFANLPKDVQDAFNNDVLTFMKADEAKISQVLNDILASRMPKQEEKKDGDK